MKSSSHKPLAVSLSVAAGLASCSAPRATAQLPYWQPFDQDTASTAATRTAYPELSFDLDAAATATVVGGVLQLEGNTGNPPLESVSHIGYPGNLMIDLDLGASAGTVLRFNVFLDLTSSRMVFHPGSAGGNFRIEGITRNLDMGFTPALGVLHHLHVSIDASSGAVEGWVANGSNPAEQFAFSYVDSAYVGGAPISFGTVGGGDPATIIADNLRIVAVPECCRSALAVSFALVSFGLGRRRSRQAD